MVCWRSLNRALQATWNLTTPQMYWSSSSTGLGPSPLWAGVGPGPAATSSKVQITSLVGRMAFLWGRATVSTPSSWRVFFFSMRRSQASILRKPKRLENHLRVSQTRCILWGLASSALILFKWSRTSASVHGTWENPCAWRFSKAKQWILRVLNLVSPNRSIHSLSWSLPMTEAMLGILSAKGAKRQMSRWAHFNRSSFSSCRWVIGSVSWSCLGFQCLHLATGAGRLGGCW